MKFKKGGLVVVVCGGLVLIVLGIGKLIPFLQEISFLFTGKIELISRAPDLRTQSLIVIFVTSLALLFCFFFGIVFRLIFKEKIKRKNIQKFSIKNPYMLGCLMIGVPIEEIYARWLFLGPTFRFFSRFLNPSIAFYALFSLGNLSWALLHLWEFKVARKLYFVLVITPLLIVGVLFTYSYLKCNILGAIISHFAADFLLLVFSTFHNKFLSNHKIS